MIDIENLTHEAHQGAEIIKNTEATEKMNQRGIPATIDGQGPVPDLKKKVALMVSESDLLGISTDLQDLPDKNPDQSMTKNAEITQMKTQKGLEMIIKKIRGEQTPKDTISNQKVQ